MKTEIMGLATNILQARELVKAESSGNAQESPAAVSFMQLMSQSGSYPNVKAASGQEELVYRVEAGGSNATQTAYDSYTGSVKNISVKEEVPQEELLKEASELMEGYEEEIRSVLKEELGVTDEEIDAALEALGFTIQDLGNVQNLTAFVQELTGEDIGALFLSEAFQNVKSQIMAATETLCAELGITKEDWNALTEALAEMKTEELPKAELEAADPAAEQPVMETETEAAEAIDAKPNDTAAAETGKDIAAEAVEETVQPEDTADSSAVKPAEEAAASAEDKPAAAETTANAEETSKADTPVQTAAAAENAEELPEEDALRRILEDPKEKAERTVSEAAVNVQEDTDADTQTGEWQSQSQQQSAGQKQAEAHAAAAGEHVNAMFAEGQTVRTDEFIVPQPETAVPYSSQLDAMELIEQIARHVRVTISSDVTSMEMQLNPENLGKIYLNISEKEGAVRAQITAQNQVVKEALETQVAELRQSLSQQGIKVDAIEVTVASHEFEQNLEENARQEEQMRQQMEESQKKARRSLNLSELDELSGLMTEEEQLAAQIMRDNGNQVDLTA